MAACLPAVAPAAPAPSVASTKKEQPPRRPSPRSYRGLATQQEATPGPRVLPPSLAAASPEKAPPAPPLRQPSQQKASFEAGVAAAATKEAEAPVGGGDGAAKGSQKGSPQKATLPTSSSLNSSSSMTSAMAEAAAQLAAAAEKSWASSTSSSGSGGSSSSTNNRAREDWDEKATGVGAAPRSRPPPSPPPSSPPSPPPSDPRLDALLRRQHNECPKIVKELQQHRRKVRFRVLQMRTHTPRTAFVSLDYRLRFLRVCVPQYLSKLPPFFVPTATAMLFPPVSYLLIFFFFSLLYRCPTGPGGCSPPKCRAPPSRLHAPASPPKRRLCS